MKNKARVHHIPTDKPEEWWKHLYITTDEEIKEGDWFYYNHNGGVVGQYKKGMGEVDGKIIATTDPELSGKTGQLPQSFIEEYCKAGGIDEVLVEYEERFIENSLKNYKRMLDEVIEIVPKLNSNNCIIIHPVEEKISINKSKLWEKLESLRLTSDEELRVKYPIKPQVGMGIDWNKWIEENL